LTKLNKGVRCYKKRHDNYRSVFFWGDTKSYSLLVRLRWQILKDYQGVWYRELGAEEKALQVRLGWVAK
jgi:hypothetical protein